jgi:hypothetical protein
LKHHIHISNVEKGACGKSNQLRYIADVLAPKNQWFLYIDDNVTGFTAVSDKYYKEPKLPVTDYPEKFRKIYDTKISPEKFLDHAQETIAFAETIKARLAGFALVDNFFFRGMKFRTVGAILGKVMLIKNENFYLPQDMSMDDWFLTSYHLLKYGCVAINNYVWRIGKNFQKGGMGARVARTPIRIQNIRYLMQQFPGLWKIKNTKDGYPNIQLRLNTGKQIHDWRIQLYTQRKK